MPEAHDWANLALRIGQAVREGDTGPTRACELVREAVHTDAVAVFLHDGVSFRTIAAAPANSEIVDAMRDALAALDEPEALSAAYDPFRDEGPLGTSLETAGVRAAFLSPAFEQDRTLGVLVALDTKPREWTSAEATGLELTAVVMGKGAGCPDRAVAREELERQKSGFIATTNHELRTPLTSIAGYLEILRDGGYGPLTPEQDSVLGAVERNVVRLGGLIENLLLLSRLESRGGVWSPQHPQPTDLADLLGAVADEFQIDATRRGLAVSLDIPAGLVVNGERAALSRAFGNLVDNALKFTPQGGSVRIDAAAEDRVVKVRVTDTGRGVPAEELLRVRERFTRGSDATRLHIPGVGNGLAVARAVIEGHGGSLDISSVEDVGTECAVTLPLLGDAPGKV